jgi:hypothetical protein
MPDTRSHPTWRTLRLQLALPRDLYEAVLTTAHRAGPAPTDFCAVACVPALEQTGVRLGGNGKVIRARFAVLGTDLGAELVLTQELYLTLLGNRQGQTVEQVCREACRTALARATGRRIPP